jgi:hypothetical protein
VKRGKRRGDHGDPKGMLTLEGKRRQATWRRTTMATSGGPRWWRCFSVIPGTRCGGGASARRGGTFRGVGYDRRRKTSAGELSIRRRCLCADDAGQQRDAACRGEARCRARKPLTARFIGDVARESGAGATRTPRRGGTVLRRSPGDGRRWLGPDGLRAGRNGWGRLDWVGAGLRFGPAGLRDRGAIAVNTKIW